MQLWLVSNLNVLKALDVLRHTSLLRIAFHTIVQISSNVVVTLFLHGRTPTISYVSHGL